MKRRIKLSAAKVYGKFMGFLIGAADKAALDAGRGDVKKQKKNGLINAESSGLSIDETGVKALCFYFG